MSHLDLIEACLDGRMLDSSELERLISLEDPQAIQDLYDGALRGKAKWVGGATYFRGLIECCNICIKDCYYCGIRNSNGAIQRYEMAEEEILTEALWAHKQGYGSIVIQAGERQDRHFITLIERILRELSKQCGNTLGITLSLGEQHYSTYERWKDAGAHRYLLRIETSNPELYRTIHPDDHRHDQRVDCLHVLRALGYQVGTGIMTGLPGQTHGDLVQDLLFMQELDVDMVGLGPFIPHSQTPLYHDNRPRLCQTSKDSLTLALKMVALCRLVLRDVNIAAATALQALYPTGREMALQAGANVIMPNLTETSLRTHYALYENKPCTGEAASQCKGCLTSRIEQFGGQIAFNERGDSPHFLRRKGTLAPH